MFNFDGQEDDQAAYDLSPSLSLSLSTSIFEPMRTIRWIHSYLKEKQKFKQVRTTNLVFFMHAVRRFMLEFIEIVILFFMQTHEKETQLGNYV